MSDTLLTPAQIAARLRVGREKIARWIASGALPAVNVGDGLRKPRWRVDPADLAAFLARRRAAPKTPLPRRRGRATTPEYV